jgi:hypothetical protein
VVQYVCDARHVICSMREVAIENIGKSRYDFAKVDLGVAINVQIRKVLSLPVSSICAILLHPRTALEIAISTRRKAVSLNT